MVLVRRSPEKPPEAEYFEQAQEAKSRFKTLMTKEPEAGLELWTSDAGRIKRRRAKTEAAPEKKKAVAAPEKKKAAK